MKGLLIYTIWPLACIAFMFLGAHFWHPGFWPWAAGLGVVLIGVGVTIYQVKTGGDTTIFPYIIMVAGLLLFCSLAVR